MSHVRSTQFTQVIDGRAAYSIDIANGEPPISIEFYQSVPPAVSGPYIVIHPHVALTAIVLVRFPLADPLGVTSNVNIILHVAEISMSGRLNPLL